MLDIGKIIDLLNKNMKSIFSDFRGSYLYGSHANRTNSENSDIDIVALFDTKLTREQRLKLWTIVGNIEAEYNIILDLHPMNNEELRNNPIYYDQVVNKGLFYGI